MRNSTLPEHWTAAYIPDQRGRFAVITGTGGLGFEGAVALARSGASVVLAGRNAHKGADAVAAIRQAAPASDIRYERLDLACLASVADFAARLRGQMDRLDLLINNAAVMNPPARQETEDGFELQLGTNYLGHFALTGHLLPLLRKGANARVISVSSIAARNGLINLEDLQAEQSYRPGSAYAQSKLACLMFALELHRRSQLGGWGVASIAAHPGVSRTELLHNAPGRGSPASLARSLLWFLFQPADQGALPTLFAATWPEAKSGAYYGPHGLSETRGFPAAAQIPPQALDAALSARLWEVSENLTGVTLR
ncbi:oxidoreductase, short chain dehydrogenase/reductase family [Hyphomonas neptunium ATCC 15444]|uniref:Oxidoreductase, short chain dehydrogenase/reductase family n=2 Tax=Hyphomonas TaxID=85 RepID=Q0C026_HYPNA|nr:MULTISPECIES: SDR family oxidoreductase [Hyphomonas]ABI78318.1 oxidoreductase, short chain dehydrogenase/reductase family [Hyphomonas neptunium ATCC 15444]KCZ86605.1 short chain dehydrogenase/reductase family oxidoreductase [Hyphomonas hirschiana VP5]